MKKGCAIWGAGVCVLLAVGGVFAYFRWFNFPAEAQNAERIFAELTAADQLPTPAELCPPLGPGEINAAPLLPSKFGRGPMVQLAMERAKSPAEFLAYVAANRAEVDAYRAASQANRFRPEPLSKAFDDLREDGYSDMVSLSHGCKILARNGQLLLRSGKVNQGLADLEASRRLTILATDLPTFANSLSASSMTAATCGLIARAAAENPKDQRILSELASLLDKPFGDASYSRLIACEFWQSMAMLQAPPPILSSDADIEEWRRKAAASWESQTGLPSGAYKRGMAAPVIGQLKDILAISSRPSDIPAAKMKLIKQAMAKWDKRSGDQPVIGSVAGLIFYDQLYGAVTASKSYTATARAYVAALKHKLKAGAVPTTSAGFSNDPATGKPVGYRVTANGFRVWTTGTDLQDDGGIAKRDMPGKKNGDWVLSFPFDEGRRQQGDGPATNP